MSRWLRSASRTTSWISCFPKYLAYSFPFLNITSSAILCVGHRFLCLCFLWDANVKLIDEYFVHADTMIIPRQKCSCLRFLASNARLPFFVLYLVAWSKRVAGLTCNTVGLNHATVTRVILLESWRLTLFPRYTSIKSRGARPCSPSLPCLSRPERRCFTSLHMSLLPFSTGLLRSMHLYHERDHI